MCKPDRQKPPPQFGLESIPPDVLEIVERLFRLGFSVYVVGGALRDILFGESPKDWDLATDATPEKVMEIFPKVFPLGIRFGTVVVLTRKRQVEITTFPGESGILGDLARRDFTLNALALSYPEGVLLDPHDGRKDLDTLTLRAVGTAVARFREDPLRILRAARFVSRYGFRVEETTSDAMASLCGELRRIAVERIREEISATITGPHIREAFRVLHQCGALRTVLPELEASPAPSECFSAATDVYGHIAEMIHYCPPSIRVRTAALLHTVPSLAPAVMTRWKMSTNRIREISTLTDNRIPSAAHSWTDATMRQYMAQIGTELLGDALDLAAAHERSVGGPFVSSESVENLRARFSTQIERNVPISIKNLAINGHDVVQILGIRPGPAVGTILKDIHREVLINPDLNIKSVLIDFLRNRYKK